MGKNCIFIVRIMICLCLLVIAAALSQGAVITQEKFQRFIHPNKEEGVGSIYFSDEPEKEIEDDGTDGKKVKVIKKNPLLKKNKGLEGLFQKSTAVYTTIGGLVLGSITITYFVRRKKKKIVNPLMKKDIKVVENERENHENAGEFTFLPEEEIRVALIEWEKTLPQYEKRRSFETIQRWLSRIKRSDEIISIYEQVRYGRKIGSSEEIHRLKKWTEKN
ncbi:hypothetical protein WAX78_03905 [Bacillus sp. FJAT-53711]|uniref:DUF4129 domain-containing protein n=1 Tax=Bacillus yunxiaonensis TaxID=3127665 RepID=A0ABU8FUC0_9BACI